MKTVYEWTNEKLQMYNQKKGILILPKHIIGYLIENTVYEWTNEKRESINHCYIAQTRHFRYGMFISLYIYILDLFYKDLCYVLYFYFHCHINIFSLKMKKDFFQKVSVCSVG